MPETMIDTPTALAEELKSRIAFQRKWKTVCMFAYSISSSGVIVCSTGALFFAALNYGMVAAAFAAVSTVLAAAEKSLLFREKWKVHLSTQTALENLELDLRIGAIETHAALDELKRIGQAYGKDLPVESRIG